MKLCERKEFYKNETATLSGSLSDNRDALVKANKIIKDLDKEANELAESIGLYKDVILAAARADSDNNGSEMTSNHVSYSSCLRLVKGTEALVQFEAAVYNLQPFEAITLRHSFHQAYTNTAGKEGVRRSVTCTLFSNSRQSFKVESLNVARKSALCL